jgi:hypothetical protein
MPQQVEVKRTVVSMRDYARAVLKAGKEADGEFYSKKSIAVLYAQYMIETGGRACWNWNIGNVKHVKGDGYDWMALSGVWEGVHPVAAEALIKRGDAILDTHKDHIKAVGKHRVSVIFKAGHPASLFRSYPSLDVAMRGHLKLLKGRFGLCWPDVMEGDYRGFAYTLKAGPDGKLNTADDYFTAQAEAYAVGMAPHFFNFVNSMMYETELQSLIEAMDAPTLSQLPDDAPTVPVAVPEMRPDPMGHVAIIHPDVPLGRPALDDLDDVPSGGQEDDE